MQQLRFTMELPPQQTAAATLVSLVRGSVIRNGRGMTLRKTQNSGPNQDPCFHTFQIWPPHHEQLADAEGLR